jgi:hypothetical protein
MSTPAEQLIARLGEHHNVNWSAPVEHDLVEVSLGERARIVMLRALTGASLDLAGAYELEIEPADVVVMIRYGAGYEWSAKEVVRDRGSDLYTIAQLWGALQSKLKGYEEPKVRYFLSRFEDHNRVTAIERLSDRLVTIERQGLEPLVVHIADEYILSEEFVLKVLRADPGVDIIANISQWNHYSPIGAQTARDYGIRVFDHKELYGALNYPKEQIATYMVG